MSRIRSKVSSRPCLLTELLSRGTPTGKMIKIGDGSLDAYVAEAPKDKAHNGAAIIYLPDIFGFAEGAKLICDQLAANGYTTLLPDVFKGDNFSGSDPVQWIFNGSSGEQPHTPDSIDPVVSAGIKALKEGFRANKIGAVGYCLGAKYVARHFKTGVDVGYMAHPSFVDKEELSAITGPLSVAAAEMDDIFPAEKRHESEIILKDTRQPYQITLYSGVEHGFACRGDTSTKVTKFAKESAFLQAVNWFDAWLL